MRLSSDFILKVKHYFSLKEGFTIIFRCFDPRQHHFEQHTHYDVAWDRRGGGDWGGKMIETFSQKGKEKTCTIDVDLLTVLP